jgi:trk system potassium uptake protein TrkH
VGGLGIVVFMIAVFAHSRVVMPLYYAEGRFERLEPSLRRTVRELLVLYTVLTAIAIAALYIAGMGVFDAVNHALASVATGGFSTRNESIAYYGSRVIEAATMFTMWLGATNFLDHKYLLTGKIRRFLSSVEFRAFVWIMILGVAGIEWMVWMGVGGPEKLWSMTYQFVSALTTTGFQTMNIHAANDAFKMLLITAMLIGGSVFSTAGGMKLLRVVLGFEAFKMQVKKMFYPQGYTPRYRLGRYAVSPEIVAGALVVSFLYIAITVASGMIVYFYAPGYSFMDSLFEAASAVGTVGLSTGISSASLASAPKLVLITDMMLGRLEILPYILVLYSLTRRLAGH